MDIDISNKSESNSLSLLIPEKIQSRVRNLSNDTQDDGYLSG